ncbi:hypothetical protein PF005_g33211 [Phytophthora fragariae]|uniref:Secreted protein n=1 Tax=Phytophthora fragariae TaxID=53985 RepID=A0A6A3V113_9STRA|nr:hypothetical protein PF009_g33026 [Phytophthora fragariae]KAE9053858.1 hypothetical protein PF007_g32826 [Phytophthora fragariae]KAE9156439.1 hypothetical protein PF005_g33211 [Phytophthora fragariae]KAE9158106.1 hypothetical protein PF002_g33188 [Phytophthora fragariae]
MSASGWLISCSTGSIVAESLWAAANFALVVVTSSSCSGRDSSCRGSGLSPLLSPFVLRTRPSLPLVGHIPRERCRSYAGRSWGHS